MSKINRNDSCPCGSGKKYKKCCGTKESQAKKPSLRGFSPFPKGANTSQSPSLALARRAFKVLSAPSNASAPKESDEPFAPQRGYQSLEELIGVEGAPKPNVPSPQKEE